MLQMISDRATLEMGLSIGSVAIRPASLNLEGAAAKRQQLLALAEQVPGGWIGMKPAALRLVLEGQRPGWIAEMLGLTRMRLCRWVHSVNEQGVQSLPACPKPGRPGALMHRVRRELEAHLERSPQEFGLSRVQWDGPTLVVHLKRRLGISLKVRQA